jgi:hypothetical protein
MAFVKIDNNNFERVTLNLKPETHFISSSLGLGVTGSNYVSPFRSDCLKQDVMFRQQEDSKGNTELVVDNEKSPKNILEGIIGSRLTDNFDLKKNLENYMSVVGNASEVIKNTKTIDIFRFDQPVNLNKNRTIKNITKKILMPHHRHRYDNCDFSYGNYHALNFFSGGLIPTGSAIVYPNNNENYDLPSAFSLNFWINPRRSDPGEYKAGTILHLSSSICVSIVSGSSKDEKNAANNFRILLQLSQSADKQPSQINLNSPALSYPNDLVFTSSHTLSKNHWHHVCIQWSNTFNGSTGSIFIDDNESNFYVNSSSLGANSNLSPPGLVVGNYFNATYGTQSNLLNSSSAEREGFIPVVDGAISDPTLTEGMLNHPLNAEIHELKMYNKVLNTVTSQFVDERERAKNEGPESYDNLVFYIPPFFYPKTPTREVLVTPFQTITDYTDDPFNTSFSFGVNGKMINLENFTREFVVGQNPRLVNLVPETISADAQNITADQFVYHSGSHIKRNMTILPNDNGLFKPNYFVLSNSEMSSSAKWFSDSNRTQGTPNYSIISLENLVPTASLYPGLVASQGAIFEEIAGSSPENPGVAPGSVLTIPQRTRDVSSNEIIIADISNLYYGNRIHPSTFEMYDKNLTGSEGKIKIKVKDNGRGLLHRADALTKIASWNSVGNIFYDEGVAILKSPHLFYYGKDLLDVKFKGEQNIHTMILNVPAYHEMFTSSSNPTFTSISPSSGANNEDLSTLYITTVNIHDDNLNIIMKANFSQPIFKTEEDEFIIRLKEDF